MSASSAYQRIYAAVKKIPRGRVATYGQIANLAGLPRHARQVGYALFNTPDDIHIPWHRVINAKGEISARSRDLYENIQRRKIKQEGIRFGKDGKISLKRFQWDKR